MGPSPPIDAAELRRYVRRVGDRWPLERALIGGGRPAGDGRAEPHVVVLVSDAFDGVPWLERVRSCAALWDRAETGVEAEVHCHTPAEFERRAATLPQLQRALDGAVDLLAAV